MEEAGAEQPFPTCECIKLVLFRFVLNSSLGLRNQDKHDFRSGRVALRPPLF